MNQAERIIRVIKDHNLTSAEFCRKLRIPKQSVTNWKSGLRPVPDKILVKIIREFPDVNARWLITGQEGIEEKTMMDFFIKQIEVKDKLLEKLTELRKELIS